MKIELKKTTCHAITKDCRAVKILATNANASRGAPFAKNPATVIPTAIIVFPAATVKAPAIPKAVPVIMLPENVTLIFAKPVVQVFIFPLYYCRFNLIITFFIHFL